MWTNTGIETIRKLKSDLVNFEQLLEKPVITMYFNSLCVFYKVNTVATT